MGDDGSGIRRVAGLHPTEEGQERGWVLWHAVVRPRRELELTNLPLLARAILEKNRKRERERWVGRVDGVILWAVLYHQATVMHVMSYMLKHEQTLKPDTT